MAALLAVSAGAGIGSVAGAAFLAYAATIVIVVVKFPVDLVHVVKASGRGTVMTIVITAIVLVGIVRAFRGLM